VTVCAVPGKLGAGVALPDGNDEKVASVPARVITVEDGTKLCSGKAIIGESAVEPITIGQKGMTSVVSGGTAMMVVLVPVDPAALVQTEVTMEGKLIVVVLPSG
jgi:hypothetical protein